MRVATAISLPPLLPFSIAHQAGSRDPIIFDCFRKSHDYRIRTVVSAYPYLWVGRALGTPDLPTVTVMGGRETSRSSPHWKLRLCTNFFDWCWNVFVYFPINLLCTRLRLEVWRFPSPTGEGTWGFLIGGNLAFGTKKTSAQISIFCHPCVKQGICRNFLLPPSRRTSCLHCNLPPLPCCSADCWVGVLPARC